MKLKGEVSLQATKSKVWRILTTPQIVTALLPQGEVIEVSDGVWRARLSPATSLGLSRFEFDFTLIELRPEEYIQVEGHGYGAQNVVDLTASLHLSEEGGSTKVEWKSEVFLGGVLASLGQRSLPYVLHRQIEEVLRAIETSTA